MKSKNFPIPRWAGWGLVVGWVVFTGATASGQLYRSRPKTPTPQRQVKSKIVVSRPTAVPADPVVVNQLQMAWMSNPVTFSLNLGVQQTPTGIAVTGFVPNASVKQIALKVAMETGVGRIEDRVQVHPGMPVRIPVRVDKAALKASIVDALEEASPGISETVRVYTSSTGKVTLAGSVMSTEETLTLCQALRSVNGCSSLINRLQTTGLPSPMVPQVQVATQTPKIRPVPTPQYVAPAPMAVSQPPVTSPLQQPPQVVANTPKQTPPYRIPKQTVEPPVMEIPKANIPFHQPVAVSPNVKPHEAPQVAKNVEPVFAEEPSPLPKVPSVPSIAKAPTPLPTFTTDPTIAKKSNPLPNLTSVPVAARNPSPRKPWQEPITPKLPTVPRVTNPVEVVNAGASAVTAANKPAATPEWEKTPPKKLNLGTTDVIVEQPRVPTLVKKTPSPRPSQTTTWKSDTLVKNASSTTWSNTSGRPYTTKARVVVWETQSNDSTGTAPKQPTPTKPHVVAKKPVPSQPVAKTETSSPSLTKARAEILAKCNGKVSDVRFQQLPDGVTQVTVFAPSVTDVDQGLVAQILFGANARFNLEFQQTQPD